MVDTPYIHFARHECPTQTPELRTATDEPGRYYRATVTSPAYETPFPFDTLISSWDARTPEGAGMRLEIRAYSAGSCSGWLDLGVWAGAPDAMRHSAYDEDADDPEWKVETDTVVSRRGKRGDAYAFRLTLVAVKPRLPPVVRSISAAVSDSSRHGEPPGVAPLKAAWGADLPVPARSQMAYGRGEEWCSPASLSMVMAYWAARTGEVELDRGVPEVARGVYDDAYGGWGNWPFNTAYASQLGLKAAVSRLGAVEQAERWVSAGVPLVASIAWDNERPGQGLSGALLTRSDGHLLVVRGFTASGDVIVNDPAASSDTGVRRVYERREFSRAWLTNPGSSGGVVYLSYPPGWPAPGPEAARGSW